MSFNPGPAGDARVVPAGDRWTLIFIRDLRHPPAVVWTALTDPAELDRWAPFAAPHDLGKTGETTLTMVDGDERVDLPATVLRAEPPVLLEYTWADDRLRWDLEPTAAGTRLTLHHTLAEPGMQAMVAAGWHLCAEVLRRLLDGDPVPVIRGRAAMEFGFEGLRAAYAEKFGA
ncbi:MAG TPA: SRPBCC family protein [Actinoplanes sp.]